MADLTDRCERLGVPLELVARGQCDRLAGARAQGVCAQVTVDYAPVRDLLDGERERATRVRENSRLLVFLDGVEDPHNLGAILRSAEAAGARGVIIPARRSAHLTAAVVRASAGAALLLPTCMVPNLAEALRQAREAGYWLVGLDPLAPQPLAPAPAGQAVGLVVGGEGAGLRRLVADRCDTLARLPMRGRVGSLNASVAAAVGIYRLCEPDLFISSAVDSGKSG